jgi:hypothetical protein
MRTSSLRDCLGLDKVDRTCHAVEYFVNNGIQNYLNPMSQGGDGNLIHSVNMTSMPYGAKSKRPGYASFLGTPDNAQVNSLFLFPNIGNSGSMELCRASGSTLYYSTQGTGAWTAFANGTIANNAHFGQAILNNTLIGGDGVGSTRHSTDGSTFTNTTGAPVSPFFANYQYAIYAAGTNNMFIKSTDGDCTNWNSSGTSNGNAITLYAAGSMTNLFTIADKLILTKSRGDMYAWDGLSLGNLATRYGPSSPYSISDIEDYRFFINQYGHFGFDRGNNIQLLSNPVQRMFYNKNNTGIQGTLFSTIPGGCHVYDYFASIGTVTDDFTQRTINNAILNYNYQKNEYLMWSMYDNPTAYLSYNDVNNTRQLIFGNATGQCFQLNRAATSDNGQPINTELVFLFEYSASSEAISKSSASTSSATAYDKKWNWIRLFFNPGCEVNIQGAFSNSFSYPTLKWFDINDNSANPSQNTADGICEFRFPQDSRSRLFFLRIYDSSTTSAWTYYGCTLDATPNVIR